MYCGEPLEGCPVCEESGRSGYKFCKRCGRPLAQPEVPCLGFDLRTVAVYASLLLAILLIMELASMFTGIGSTFSWCADQGALDVYVLIPTLEVAGILTGGALQAFWIVLVVAITASVLLVFWQSLRPLRDADPVRRSEGFMRTPLYWLALLFCATVLLSVVITALQIDMISVPSKITVGADPNSFLTYANAAVWEEVISRVVYIGVPMMVLALICKRRDFAKYLLGGFGMSRAAIILIVLSAVVFGFGHASGWGIGKVLPTFIPGLAMGYLYARFGIHVSITFHFAFDYTAVMYGTLLPVAVGLMMLFMVAGIPCLVDIARRMWGSREYVRDMPNVMPPDQESIFSKRE